MWILFVLEAVAIVTGNVAVLVVFTRTPSLRKRKHYLLVNLAAADLLVGLISVPMYVALALENYAPTLIRMYKIQDILFGTASVFGLTSLAIERAYAVYFPFKHRTLRKSTYIIDVAVTWLMATLLASSESYAKQYMNLVIILAIFISLFIVLSSYTIIWVRMNCMTPIPNHTITRRDKKLTVTLLIVTAISMIAWIPFLIISLMALLGQSHRIEGLRTVVMVTKCFHYGNSLINPIIYALRMPDFKRALPIRLVCFHYLRRRLVFDENSSENKSNDGVYLETRGETHNQHRNKLSSVTIEGLVIMETTV